MKVMTHFRLMRISRYTGGQKKREREGRRKRKARKKKRR
jgi:hypothetical protein